MFEPTENEAEVERLYPLAPGVYREPRGCERVLIVIDAEHGKTLYLDHFGKVALAIVPPVSPRDRIDTPYADAIVACAQELKEAHEQRQPDAFDRLLRVLGELALAAEREWQP